MALWRHDDASLRWPAWSEAPDGDAVASYASVPVDWRRLVDEPDPSRAALALARELAARPERLAELSPPLLAGIREPAAGRLTILGDFAGAGRLYEMRFDGGGSGPGVTGTVWSNRLGALPIFAGTAPRADRDSWLLFAAAGWFISDATPVAGAHKVPPGVAIRVTVNPGDPAAGARIELADAGALGALVAPRDEPLDRAVDRAAADAVGLCMGIEAAYEAPPRIDLSGGRDSRVSAAAAVAAGIPCFVRTGDNVPGELEIAERLVAAAPIELEHNVTRGESGQPEDELADRVRAIHLVHDGMRNPQELRRPMNLPLGAKPRRPTMSGHGGEIAHGFYYTSARKLREIRDGGDAGLVDRMDRAARRKAPAARKEAYARHREEIELILDAGRAHGLAGPVLLDWFYLVHRLAYRSGLGARSNRFSACATPGFVRASFDLTPEERLEAKLHNALIPRLVPEWAPIEFLNTKAKADLPEITRDYIWDKPGHAEHVDDVVRAGGAWEEAFDRRRVRKMWKQARRGKGHRHFETIFNRVVWRQAFEEHLRTLARAAGAT